MSKKIAKPFSSDDTDFISTLKAAFAVAGVSDAMIRFEKLFTGYVSVYVCDSLFLKFKITPSNRHLLISDKYAELFPDGIFRKEKIEADGINTRACFDDLNHPDFINCIKSMIDRFGSGKLFDCCGRYLECSDAKVCTQPDKARAFGCSYRLKLADGIIFFGKNRNIDK